MKRRETPITLRFYCKQEKKETIGYVERKKLSITTKYVLVLNQQNKPILFYMKTINIYIFVKMIING